MLNISAATPAITAPATKAAAAIFATVSLRMPQALSQAAIFLISTIIAAPFALCLRLKSAKISAIALHIVDTVFRATPASGILPSLLAKRAPVATLWLSVGSWLSADFGNLAGKPRRTCDSRESIAGLRG